MADSSSPVWAPRPGDAGAGRSELHRLVTRLDEAFDIVFNVASINYFEEKKKAIDEMFRVAKPGARMMIVDETEKAAHAHNKLPLYRGYFNSSKEPVVPPIDLLPGNATDVKLTEIRNGLYFVLEFRKGS